jgi:hypothetical protein
MSRCPICHKRNCTTQHRAGTRDRRAVARAAYARRRAARYGRGHWPTGSTSQLAPSNTPGQIVATGISSNTEQVNA